MSEYFLYLVIGLLIGAALVLYFARASRAELKREISSLKTERGLKDDEIAKFRNEIQATFSKLATDALRSNSHNFLNLADQNFQKFHIESKNDLETRKESIRNLIMPLSQTLAKFESNVRELERTRERAYSSISIELEKLASGHKDLRDETKNLVHALKQPKTRGRWGEYQLQNVFELVGMTENVDYKLEQVITNENSMHRPDAIVNLPGGRHLVIDVKTPLDSYLAAIDSEDQSIRSSHLKDHAKHVRQHVRALSTKQYWNSLSVGDTADFVVMFIPGEAFYSVAVEKDPDLFEYAIQRNVVLATPMTLVVLLKSVILGWQQQKLTRHVNEIADGGRELYDRLGTYLSHVDKLGTSLHKTVDSYNKAIGSMERRVLPSARKMKDMQLLSSEREINHPKSVEIRPRNIRAPEANNGTEKNENYNLD